jgi:hypothetical protein
MVARPAALPTLVNLRSRCGSDLGFHSAGCFRVALARWQPYKAASHERNHTALEPT